MGRVQADLPETSISADGPGAPAADDFLAQLAGEDIDRMLAEADVEASPLPAAIPANGAISTTIDDRELSEGLDSLSKEMDEGEAARIDAKAAATANAAAGGVAASGDAANSPEVNAIDGGATATAFDAPHGEFENSTSPQTASFPSAPAAAQSSLTAEPDRQPETALSDISGAGEIHSEPEPAAASTATNDAVAAVASPEEMGKSDAVPASAPRPIPAEAASPKLFVEPAAQAAGHGSAQAVSNDDDAVPVYIHVLEILNSPLDALPDPIRSALGKIALVTLLNAVVVIGYVLLFRRR